MSLAILMVALPLLAGCASNFETAYRDYARPSGGNPLQDGQAPLQCVPFAREHSQIKIYGDAWTWWDQAAGRFARDSAPQTGAILVLTGYAGPDHGHLAVVQKIVSSREIRVDHANWLNDGSVYLDDPVVDVSPDNDWSLVKVWNIPAGAWGAKSYPVKGFILPAAPDARIAQARELENIQ